MSLSVGFYLLTPERPGLDYGTVRHVQAMSACLALVLAALPVIWYFAIHAPGDCAACRALSCAWWGRRRRKLDPGLKAKRFQTLVIERIKVLSI